MFYLLLASLCVLACSSAGANEVRQVGEIPFWFHLVLSLYVQDNVPLASVVPLRLACHPHRMYGYQQLLQLG